MRRKWTSLSNSRAPAGMPATSGYLGGNAGIQSVLDPAGPQAAHISELWWLMFALCTVIFVAVIGVLLYAVLRARVHMAEPGPQAEHRMILMVGKGVAVTVIILFVLLIASVSTGRGLASLVTTDALHLAVIGH